MLFNSIDFAIFLPIVFFGYWFVFNKNLRVQNLFIIVVSYFFYGWWDWRFLSLIAFSTGVDYAVGLALKNQEDVVKRRLLLLASILVNLGFLGFFKYFNFFADNFVSAFSLFGQSFEVDRIEILLPVGISFYTFQTMSYTIDVYKRKIDSTTDIASFFAFVSFFPQLVAGPIERASNLLPQFFKIRTFDHAKAADGMRQILWGLFKKMVIADNCATHVNHIFLNYQDYSGTTLLLGAILFAFQIYGDFSGYSDIAIGTARLFGFTLRQNFAFPYFSRDIAEFWRRWHISLSSWFKDYLYIPLGGSRGGLWNKIRNTFIIFLVSGFWHGANWTFVIWGALNALYFLPLLLSNQNRLNTNTVAENTVLPSFKEFFQMLVTFLLTCLAWIFFRSASLPDALMYLSQMVGSFLNHPAQMLLFLDTSTVIFIIILLIVEWIHRRKQHGLVLEFKYFVKYRHLFYYGLILIIIIFSNQNEEFIYFQF